MFDLEPTEELSLIAETARKFAEAELLPKLREAEAQRAVGPGVRAAYDEIGLASLELPESLGGAGFGSLARALVNEELAAADAGAAIALDAPGPALYPALEASEAAIVEQLAGLEGDARPVLLCEEDCGLVFAGASASGTAPWVAAETVASVVVLGREEARVLNTGFEARPLRGAGLRAAGACELHFDAAPVAARFGDAASCARARARARLYAASLLLGVMRNACDFSREYARERQAFGRPIAHHQALAFLITDMQMALDGARLLVHEAAWRIDRGLPAAGEAAAAFAQCIEASRLIGPSGVQILGGHGFMADYPMEKAMREARALGLMIGGMDAAIEDAGQALCAFGAPAQLGVVEAL